MSPDNWKKSPYFLRMQAAAAGFAGAFPELAPYFTGGSFNLRGMTMFLGDTAEWVVGLRTFGEDGSPLVVWSSGDDPLAALVNLDKAVGAGRFKPDKKAMSPSPSE